ncbi:hypothetical protein QFC24_005932 [Naganishia onofrii]|uniref:Uncharacterized protein n=1 Tax=Naganishia onofrii TaxID=1851511 RepID=A0ACC2X6C2_9TREE|nr:hypothetical protein QFC24_005932 [Naganishia onofrii]
MSAVLNTIILGLIALLLYWVFSNQPKRIAQKSLGESPFKSPEKALNQKRQVELPEEQGGTKATSGAKQSPSHPSKSDRPQRNAGEGSKPPVEAESGTRQTTKPERSSRRVRSYLGGEEPAEQSQRSRRKWPAEETASLLLEPCSFQQPEQKPTATSPVATNHRRKRALDASTSDEDNEQKPTSSRQTRKRDIKRKKHDDHEEREEAKEDDAMDVTATTLPGGYVDTDVDVEENPRPNQGQRRKRDDSSDSEDVDGDASEISDKSERERHRLHGRAVRRRRDDASTEKDEEMTLVQRSSRRSRRNKHHAGKAKASSEDAMSEKKDETSATENSSGSEQMEVDSADGRKSRPISLGLRATPFNETSTDDDDDQSEEQDEHATFTRTPNSNRNTRTTARQARKTAKQTPASMRKGKTIAVEAAKKKHAKQTPQSKRVSSRRKGEVWTAANGQKYKISTKDGVRRQLVSVKEWRHKYKMPADSVHPDKDVMHLVLVEKWVTDTELKELERVKLLGWQSDDEDSKNGNNEDLNSIGEVEDAGSPVTTKVCLSSLASAA